VLLIADVALTIYPIAQPVVAAPIIDPPNEDDKMVRLDAG
jgi:hypothetical protein